MGENSAIEWTDATWSPVTGCTKTSPACASCYIERTIPFRTKGRKFVRGHIPLEFHENRLDAPLRWRAPRRVFVCSLSDLFHEDVPDVFIDQVFAVMALAPRHTFQVLTKRADRLSAYCSALTIERLYQHVNGWASESMEPGLGRIAALRQVNGFGKTWGTDVPLPNVWIGCSVENQHFADDRIPLLLQTPAAVRFLSCEPLLGPVNLRSVPSLCQNRLRVNALNGGWDVPRNREAPGEHRQEPRLHWVIAGGESGPRVRPTDIAWTRSLRDQCVAEHVPFFWKQNGGRTSKSGGRLLDGRTWDQMPTVRA